MQARPHQSATRHRRSVLAHTTLPLLFHPPSGRTWATLPSDRRLLPREMGRGRHSTPSLPLSCRACDAHPSRARSQLVASQISNSTANSHTHTHRPCTASVTRARAAPHPQVRRSRRHWCDSIVDGRQVESRSQGTTRFAGRQRQEGIGGSGGAGCRPGAFWCTWVGCACRSQRCTINRAPWAHRRRRLSLLPAVSVGRSQSHNVRVCRDCLCRWLREASTTPPTFGSTSSRTGASRRRRHRHQTSATPTRATVTATTLTAT